MAGTIVEAFKRSVFEYKLNRTTGDAMFMNTAFLVNSGREVEFDNIMADLGQLYKENCDFKYSFPLPIFNFIDFGFYPLLAKVYIGIPAHEGGYLATAPAGGTAYSF